MSAECKYWDINYGVDDPQRFFALLLDLFPTATTLFVEGSSISPDVLACFERHRQPGEYLPKRQTLFPTSKRIRCAFSPALLEELTHLSTQHATPELLDHLCLFEEARCLLFWHDAFANAILLGADVPEASVAKLAVAFNVPYSRLN